VPRHFAERHGLIIIIALGESIVAIGAGADTSLDAGIVTAAVLGIALTAAMWWAYFDVVAIFATRHLEEAPVGRVQNEIARDSYSFLHFPMIAGIVLVALGLKKTIGHVDHHLEIVPAFALLGGLAIYLLAHVAFRYRNVHTLSLRRLLVAIILVAMIPLATEVSAIAALAGVTVIAWALITYEALRYGEARARVRHQAAP
jgi:low temperature requirement protein LtrA